MLLRYAGTRKMRSGAPSGRSRGMPRRGIADWKSSNQNPKSEIRLHPVGYECGSASAGRNPQAKGFTLLEVLLAMAILAIISTVIYGTFTNSARNIEQAEQSRDETDMARALLGRLSNDIANAYTKSTITNIPVIFYGKKEELSGETGKEDYKIRHDEIHMTTLTNWPKHESKETELWEVGYFFKEKPEGKGYTLFRREKRELSSSVPALDGGTEYEITDRVKSLQIKYLDGSNWTDNGWNRRTSPPRAAEIVIIFDSGKLYTTKVDVGSS